MKEIALVGRGESWVDCPFDGETWGTLSCYCTPILQNKHFDKVFALDVLDEELSRALELAHKNGTPVVSTHPYADEPYPLQEVLSKIYNKPYLQNSICAMIAMALLKGYDTIRIYGVEQAKGYYLLQRGATEFWCGVAVGSCTKRFECPNFQNVLIKVAPSSMLLTEYLREVANVMDIHDKETMDSIPTIQPFYMKPGTTAWTIVKEESGVK